jgi:FkbH-like protein
MPFKPTAPIKLVIWDLDDTFWNGTLSEGGITLIDKNIEMVKTLVDRGIMSSICSKNDLAPVKQRLADAGIWDYFIFPHISWAPKGGQVASIIEQANLRAENVLFIDDNSINVEEVRFLFPAIMATHPDDVLPTLLELEQARGKDDRAHSRLKQYKKLEQKVSDQTKAALSNEEFLRQCEIKLRFDYDIEPNFERIVELINRSNQLNYTKIRLETAKSIADFSENLKRFDVFSAAIFASDRYGDHGLIGFYMHLKNWEANKLVHYVWSCRMMNAGLEQYVYERLGEPTIKIISPVSNPIKVFEKIDWISETDSKEDIRSSGDRPKLLLLGGCDLLAVASYCSPNRFEYVNSVKAGVMKRYDDFGFILTDPTSVEMSKALPEIPCWDKEDVISFQNDIATSDILIISLYPATLGAYLLTRDGVVVRADPHGLGNFIDTHPWIHGLRGAQIYDLDDEQLNHLLELSLTSIDSSASKAGHKFVLGTYTRFRKIAHPRDDIDRKSRYNFVAEKFCRTNPGWHFVSVDDVLTEDRLGSDAEHYTRTGYFEIATYINDTIRQVKSAPVRQKRPREANGELIDVIRSGRPLSRLNMLGSHRRDVLGQVARVAKMTPLKGVLKKTVFKHRRDPLL